MIAKIKPIREKTEEILSDIPALDKIMRKGAEEARVRAQKTLKSAYNAIGFIPK